MSARRQETLQPQAPSRVFISATSKDLGTVRELVKQALLTLGCMPVEQSNFPPDYRSVQEMIKNKIAECEAVIHIVGVRYGAEPDPSTLPHGTPRRSYTQMEADIARQLGKKLYLFVCTEDFPYDAAPPESEELQELQRAYRTEISKSETIRTKVADREETARKVRELQFELENLKTTLVDDRRITKQWAIAVAALLALMVAGVFWLLHGQHREGVHMQLIDKKMQQALEKLAEVETRERQPGEKLTPAEQRARAYAVLEKDLGLPAGSLAKELPAFALKLYNSSDTTPLMRARAAYVLGHFEEAERLSLEGANQDRQAYESALRVAEERRKQAIEGYELAGQSAQKRVQYPVAMEHFREAEKLTSRDQNPQDWAEVQFAIANLLGEQGHYSSAENTFRSVIDVRTHVLGAEHPDTLRTRSRLAYVLWKGGKLAEAEQTFREVIGMEEKFFGAEHPDTLLSCNGLGGLLSTEWKCAEAEVEHRLVLKLREKVLGSEHPDTLRSRNNLGVALGLQGKYAEAEAQYREVMKVQEKVLGPEHPDTLLSRNNLGDALDGEGQYVEAEAQHRDLIELKAKILGREHPDTLASRHNLAVALEHEASMPRRKRKTAT